MEILFYQLLGEELMSLDLLLRFNFNSDFNYILNLQDENLIYLV